MAGKHAIYSPSGFGALMLCPAKPAMERGLPDTSSEYADEGTAAHFLGAYCSWQGGAEATDYTGQIIAVHASGECEFVEGTPASWPGTRCFTIDADFAQHVQTYVDHVRSRVEAYRAAGAQVELFVEQSVPVGHITGEQDAEGTADTVIVAVFASGRAVCEVIDLKFGRGVDVSAEDNPQLKLYALGAIEKFGMVYEFTDAVMAICQPRAGGVSESACTVAELQAWADDHAKPAAKHASWIMSMVHADGADPVNWCKPHEDACRFCKAKSTCGALARGVETALSREFTDLTTASEPERDAIVEASVAEAKAAGELSAKMDAVPLVEMWCKAIRGEVEKQLLAGAPVEGYKLVEGRKGNRQWRDPAAVETLMKKSMRLRDDQMYEQKIISPTAAEKLAPLFDKKGNLVPDQPATPIKPKQWKKLQQFIQRADPVPSVAPVSDKRPALQVQPLESEFTPIAEPAATADDLV